MQTHWKLLTFMIGGNDFCSDICYQTNATQWINRSQKKYLIKTLRFIRDNMPRCVHTEIAQYFVKTMFNFFKYYLEHS